MGGRACESEIEVGGRRLAFAEAGPESSLSSIVFIHVAGGSRKSWSLLLHDISRRGLYAIALELPGHGASPGPGSRSIDAYAGIVEAISAVRLELTLSKDEILERYLNLVYFGRGAYGIAAASQMFFDKEAADLSPREAALLAGLVQAPGRFRPFEKPGPTLARRAHVLRQMEAAGYLEDGEAASLSKLPRALRSPVPIRLGGHFVEFVRRELEDTFGTERLYRGGLRVYTTLNLKFQRAAEAAVRKGVKKLVERRWREKAKLKSWRGPEAALLAVHPQSGVIRAMVGGLDFKKSKFNRAVQALRQPGSAFKPIVYAAAIANGFTTMDSFSTRRS